MSDDTGFTVDYVGGAVPTQASGRTDDDRPFYFRARHGSWTLELGQPEDPTNYVEWAVHVHVIAAGDDDTHGCMAKDEVLAILHTHLGRVT